MMISFTVTTVTLRHRLTKCEIKATINATAAVTQTRTALTDITVAVTVPHVVVLQRGPSSCNTCAVRNPGASSQHRHTTVYGMCDTAASL